MFLQASVILSTWGGGVPDQVHSGPGSPGPGTPLPPDHVHPRDQVHPPGTRYTPQNQVQTPPHPHPPAQSMLGDTVISRAVRILLECNLVEN